MEFDLRDRTILFTMAGSRAYGIHLPTSDVDVKGVCVPPKPYFLGCAHRFEQADKPSHMAAFLDTLTKEERQAVAGTKIEGTVYDVRKFFGLAADANPNILDVLFCRDDEVRVWTPAGRLLREHRDLFISAKAKFTFSGYAAAQLKRIKGHRSWLLHPIETAPTRADFGLPEFTLIPADQLAAAQATAKKQMDSWELDMQGVDPATILHIQEQVTAAIAEVQVALGYPSPEDAKWLAAARIVGLDDNLIYVLQKEREYEAAHRHWRQYQSWKQNRNPARAALEAEFGMDCKHAGHLYRLLKMGEEILLTGKVHVWRGSEDGGPGDAEEIRGIRQGAWTYDQLIEWVEKKDQEINEIYSSRKYVVPKAPAQAAIDRLCIQLVEMMLS